MTGRHAAPTPAPALDLFLTDGFEPASEPMLHGPWLADFVAANPAPVLTYLDGDEPDPQGAPAGELFGAPAGGSMATGISPVPHVEIGGFEFATTVNRDDPRLQVVLDDLSVSWGTSSPLAQPDPATATLSLLDFDLTWAARAGLIGTPVHLYWVLDAMPALGIVAASRSFFRGRVSDVELSPTSVLLPSGVSRPATRVSLVCTSLETDFGNRFPVESSWPEESLTNRVSRIMGLTYPTVLEARTSDWGSSTCAAVPDVSSKSARELVLQLFNSCGGDRAVYNPHRNAYEWLYRRRVDVRTFGGLTRTADDAANRGGMGAFIRAHYSMAATGAQSTDFLAAGSGLWLDAAELEAVEPVRKSGANRITRAVVTSKDTGIDGDPDRTKTLIDPAADESVIGQRAITLDSLHGWNSSADLNASDLLAMATQEGAQWQPPPMRLDVRKIGGFSSGSQANALLRGYATGYMFFVERSWMTTLAVRPVFSVIGGKIGYRRGGWVLDLNFAGWAASGGGNSSPVPTKQHELTWEEIDLNNIDPPDRLEWSDVAHPRGIHETVTYEDMRYVGLPYRSSIIPPDTGSDTVQ